MRSGRTYTMLFKRKNYVSKLIRMPVERHQARLDLDIDLIPVPGTLLVKSNEPGVNLRINNASHYIHGGVKKEVIPLEPLDTNYQRFVLSPGNYYLTTMHDDAKQTAEVYIASRNYRRVVVRYDRTTQSLDCKIY
jgi:hypothetical protein